MSCPSSKFVPVIEFVRKYLDRVVTSTDSFADHNQNKLTYEVCVLTTRTADLPGMCACFYWRVVIDKSVKGRRIRLVRD